MIGREIGGFRFVGVLGRGGMGAVYEGLDLMLQRKVAIKVVSTALVHDPATAERFNQEAMALARLAHPNVTSVYSFFADGDDRYLVLELVPGEALDARLATRGALPWPEAVELACRLLDGLEHAHAQGIIHRDVKPSNCLITPTGEVKITDFGIARIAGEQRLTQTGSVVGTLHYMAPEQVAGRDLDRRTDVYSLALVLYEMLLGRVPFEADSDFEIMRAHLETVPESPRARLSSIPVWLDAAVLKALAKQRADRFATAAAFAAALRAGLDHEDMADRPTAALPAAPATRTASAPPGPPPLPATAGTGGPPVNLATRLAGAPTQSVSRPSWWHRITSGLAARWMPIATIALLAIAAIVVAVALRSDRPRKEQPPVMVAAVPTSPTGEIAPPPPVIPPASAMASPERPSVVKPPPAATAADAAPPPPEPASTQARPAPANPDDVLSAVGNAADRLRANSEVLIEVYEDYFDSEDLRTPTAFDEPLEEALERLEEAVTRVRATYDTIAVKRGRGRGGLFRRVKAKTRNAVSGRRDLATLWDDIDVAIAIGKRVETLIAKAGGDTATRRTWTQVDRHLDALARLRARR